MSTYPLATSASLSTLVWYAVPLHNNCAVSPASAALSRLTRKVGCFTLEMLSVLDLPLSLASSTSGTPGATGARVSMRISLLVDRFTAVAKEVKSTSLPAASRKVGALMPVPVPVMLKAVTAKSGVFSPAATV